MKTILLAAWLAPGGVLAQTSGGGDTWGILAAYGAAAPFALLCLFVMNRKDKEIEILRGEIATLTKVGMNDTVPALVRATTAVTESAKVLEATTTMMHQLAARGPDPKEIIRFSVLLQHVEQLLQRRGFDAS